MNTINGYQSGLPIEYFVEEGTSHSLLVYDDLDQYYNLWPLKEGQINAQFITENTCSDYEGIVKRDSRIIQIKDVFEDEQGQKFLLTTPFQGQRYFEIYQEVTSLKQSLKFLKNLLQALELLNRRSNISHQNINFKTIFINQETGQAGLLYWKEDLEPAAVKELSFSNPCQFKQKNPYQLDSKSSYLNEDIYSLIYFFIQSITSKEIIKHRTSEKIEQYNIYLKNIQNEDFFTAFLADANLRDSKLGLEKKDRDFFDNHVLPFLLDMLERADYIEDAMEEALEASSHELLDFGEVDKSDSYELNKVVEESQVIQNKILLRDFINEISILEKKYQAFFSKRTKTSTKVNPITQNVDSFVTFCEKCAQINPSKANIIAHQEPLPKTCSNNHPLFHWSKKCRFCQTEYAKEEHSCPNKNCVAYINIKVLNTENEEKNIESYENFINENQTKQKPTPTVGENTKLHKNIANEKQTDVKQKPITTQSRKNSAYDSVNTKQRVNATNESKKLATKKTTTQNKVSSNKIAPTNPKDIQADQASTQILASSKIINKFSTQITAKSKNPKAHISKKSYRPKWPIYTTISFLLFVPLLLLISIYRDITPKDVPTKNLISKPTIKVVTQKQIPFEKPKLIVQTCKNISNSYTINQRLLNQYLTTLNANKSQLEDNGDFWNLMGRIAYYKIHIDEKKQTLRNRRKDLIQQKATEFLLKAQKIYKETNKPSAIKIFCKKWMPEHFYSKQLHHESAHEAIKAIEKFLQNNDL